MKDLIVSKKCKSLVYLHLCLRYPGGMQEGREACSLCLEKGGKASQKRECFCESGGCAGACRAGGAVGRGGHGSPARDTRCPGDSQWVQMINGIVGEGEVMRDLELMLGAQALLL